MLDFNNTHFNGNNVCVCVCVCVDIELLACNVTY